MIKKPLKNQTFEDYIINIVKKYYGKSEMELSKKFDIDTYRSAFTHLKSLYNKLLSAIKNNDLVLTLGAGTVTEVGPKIVIE